VSPLAVAPFVPDLEPVPFCNIKQRRELFWLVFRERFAVRVFVPEDWNPLEANKDVLILLLFGYFVNDCFLDDYGTKDVKGSS